MPVAASEEDACNLNSKPSTPPFPLTSTHHHYFHTPLITQKGKTPQTPLCTPISLVFFCQSMFARLVFGAQILVPIFQDVFFYLNLLSRDKFI